MLKIIILIVALSLYSAHALKFRQPSDAPPMTGGPGSNTTTFDPSATPQDPSSTGPAPSSTGPAPSSNHTDSSSGPPMDCDPTTDPNCTSTQVCEDSEYEYDNGNGMCNAFSSWCQDGSYESTTCDDGSYIMRNCVDAPDGSASSCDEENHWSDEFSQFCQTGNSYEDGVSSYHHDCEDTNGGSNSHSGECQDTYGENGEHHSECLRTSSGEHIDHEGNAHYWEENCHSVSENYGESFEEHCEDHEGGSRSYTSTYDYENQVSETVECNHQEDYECCRTCTSGLDSEGTWFSDCEESDGCSADHHEDPHARFEENLEEAVKFVEACGCPTTGAAHPFPIDENGMIDIEGGVAHCPSV